MLRSIPPLVAPLIVALGLFGCRSEPPVEAPVIAAPTPHERPAAHKKARSRPREAGWWRRFRTHRMDPTLNEEQRQELAALEAIGYVSGSVEGAATTGVVRNETDRTWGALNFYTSGHAPEAFLMDNAGTVLHRWSADFDALWPQYPVGKKHNSRFCWRRAHLFPNGDVVALFGGLGMVRLDKDSHVLWALPNRAHHDLDVAPNGDIYVLTREAHSVPRVDPNKPVLEDSLVVLSPEGEEKQRLSILEAFEQSPEYREIWDKRTRHRGDLFHANTVEVLDGSLASKLAAFRAGNVLISCRANNTLAVIDLDLGRVVWAWQGSGTRVFHRQHDPSVLPNGHLLVFDNQGRKNQSSVEEYDPVTRTETWAYRGTEEDPFYSATCGAAARLPNGDTMITESDNGRAFEVDAEGRIVWEFLNPARAGADNEFIAALFEVQRLPEGFAAGWLGELP